MHVLIYTSIFPSKRNPIKGIYNLHIAKSLTKHAKVSVICPAPLRERLTAPTKIFGKATELMDGIEVRYPTFVPISRISASVNCKLFEFLTRAAVENIDKKLRIDVIFAIWGYPDSVAAYRIGRKLNCPFVVNLLGSDINNLATRRQIRPILSRALKASNRVIALNREMALRVSQLGISEKRIVVQHNGVDHDLFFLRDRLNCRRELGLPVERKIILYVGNLEPVKGPDVLLDAFATLSRETPDAMLAIVGSGSLLPQLQAEARLSGICDKIHWAGRLHHDRIPAWIGAADLLCLPSRMEGCPNVIIEAMASGRPVIATAVGGVPEIMYSGCGILVSPNNSKKLSEALATALRRSWSEIDISNSVKGFSWDKFGTSLYEVLKSAVKEGPLVEQVV